MATKRKKPGTRTTSCTTPRSPSPSRSAGATPPAPNAERFAFKFSFGGAPGELVGCVIDVVARDAGAALVRARAVLESMEWGATVTNQATWPCDGTVQGMDAGVPDMLEEDVCVYFGRSGDLMLKHVTMISDADGNDIDVDPGDLKPTTNVRKLIDRWRGNAR